MCHYEYFDYPCGDWKIGNFRAHCTKEYRTGETCGMKLVDKRIQLSEKCKTCTRIATKKNKINKEKERINRWRKEKNRKASIEASEVIIKEAEADIWKLESERMVNKHKHQENMAYESNYSDRYGYAAPNNYGGSYATTYAGY